MVFRILESTSTSTCRRKYFPNRASKKSRCIACLHVQIILIGSICLYRRIHYFMRAAGPFILHHLHIFDSLFAWAWNSRRIHDGIFHLHKCTAHWNVVESHQLSSQMNLSGPIWRLFTFSNWTSIHRCHRTRTALVDCELWKIARSSQAMRDRSSIAPY